MGKKIRSKVDGAEQVAWNRRRGTSDRCESQKSATEPSSGEKCKGGKQTVGFGVTFRHVNELQA